jgi:hypothetical protein
MLTSVSAKKSKRSQKKRVANRNPQLQAIPAWMAEPVCSRKIRWKINSPLSNDTLAGLDLSRAVVGIVATSATAGYHLARAVRLRRIDIYFCATANGTLTEAIVDWSVTTGSLVYAPNSSKEMATTSTAEMLHLQAYPPQKALSSDWQEANSTTDLVSLTAPVSSIVEIWVDYVLNDSDAAIATSPSLSGATTGTIYHRQLNADASVMGNLNTIA